MDKILAWGNSTTGLWLIRQLLQFGGAYLAFKGYTDEAGAEQLVDSIFQIAGPLTFLIGFAGNLYASFRKKAVGTAGRAIGLRELPVETQQTIKRTVSNKRQTLVERLQGL